MEEKRPMSSVAESLFVPFVKGKRWAAWSVSSKLVSLVPVRGSGRRHVSEGIVTAGSVAAARLEVVDHITGKGDIAGGRL